MLHFFIMLSYLLLLSVCSHLETKVTDLFIDYLIDLLN